MRTRPWHVIGLVAIALPALWLLLAGPQRLPGLDTGHVGMTLLVAAAWSSLLALSWLPRGASGSAVAPGEWKAWIGAGFMLATVLYFVGEADAFAGAAFNGAAFNGPDARAAGRDLVLLLVAWAVLSQVVAARWKGAVQEDERDREIAVRAAAWGRGALVVAVIALAVTLGLSPVDRLRWADPPTVANMLVLALMCGWLFEYAASAVIYVRDRRAATG